MIPVGTSAEIKSIDNAAINGDIATGMQYMNRASRGLFDLIISEILNNQKKSINSRTVIIAGSGNNGGDGILLASHLIEEGYPCICFILAEEKDLENEAQKALETLRKTKTDSYIFISNPSKLYLIKEHLNFISSSNNHAFIVDAMLGIGAKGELREPYLSTSKLINEFQGARSIIAVDSPSGVDNDSGQFQTQPIKANFTLSLGLPKLGSFFYPGRAFYGLTAIHPLSYPESIFNDNYKSNIYFINSVKEFFPPRQINGSKYNHGLALLIAGTKDMTGAAVLCARAAYRAGLGILHTATENPDIVTSLSPETITHQLNTQFKPQALNKNFQVISIGPGLSKNYYELTHKLVQESELPIILDADGINAFNDKRNILKKHKSELLITPHEGEYLRLFPNDFNANTTPIEKITAIRERAKEYKINILLKGTPNLLAESNGRVYIVPYGNSALATAGSGDVLTGIITGFSAQVMLRSMPRDDMPKLMQTAILACFLHAKAGETASLELSEYSVTASDVINYLPKVILENLK
jgi:ADP-dependent NAD(P)H-hydrate dehydratase / NAD(P)H-hydrate epimerase